MKKKFTKRLLSWLMAAAMVISMLPISAMASGTSGNVARIGEQEYATLDEALQAASVGTTGETVTIELLADATTNGMSLYRNLTIKAAEGLSQKPTLTFTQHGIALGYGNNESKPELTFRNIDVKMEGINSTPATGEWNWMTICASAGAKLTLDNVDMLMDNKNDQTEHKGANGSVTYGQHAIYFCSNNQLNLMNHSTLKIQNYVQDALEWDDGDGGYNINIKDSTFVSDHNRSGFTGTFVATITDSIVDVINSTGNGSNGSHFDITNSTVDFSNNGSHGLSAGWLHITDSTVTTNNNHGMGITVNNGFTMIKSKVTVTGNADNSSYGYAAVRLYNNFDFSVDADSSLHINNNNNTGLYVRQGNLRVENGADLEIMGNKVTHNALGGYGGGIYVGYGDNYDPTVVLPADAKIYNNHAITGGDDIYVSEGVSGPSLTFGEVGSGWALDGDPDCEHLINGWYDDSEGARWEAHANTEEGEANHIEEFTDFDEITGLATVTGLTQLKAAHDEDAKDKTSYPGLDKTIVVGDNEVKHDDVAAGDDVNFKLTSNVPDDLLNYIKPEDPEDPDVVEPVATNALVPVEERGEYVLTFHDQMDDAFVDATAPVVTLDREGTENDVTLTGTQYTYTTETGDDCDFHIVIDLVALYDDIITNADIDNATPIIVTYTATLDEDATAGTYKNTAWVTYKTEESEEVTVTVDTYGLNIFKYDQATASTDGDGTLTATGLQGAVFQLYQKNGDETIMIEQSLISDANGNITVNGLDAGTYYLKEIEAPNGYVCSTEELEIVIPNQAGTDNMVNVNFANSMIPHTGGMGTTLFSIVGGALIATAGVIFVISRKKRARSAA